MRASSLCQLFLVIVFALIACSSGGPSSTTGSSLPTAPDPAPPPPPPASTGVITVSVNTIGEQLDADGFMVVLDDEDVKALAPNDQQTLENVETGLHLVGIMGVASNCSVKHRRPAIGPETDPNPAPIEVVAGETQTLDFIVVCLPPGLGTLLVEISGRLVAMTATGGDQQPVGRVLGSQFHTNSDAERIVYTIFGGGGGADLHISDLSGLNTLNLTPTDDFAESNSALSPDGTKVVFNRLCCAPVFSDLQSARLVGRRSDGRELGRYRLDAAAGRRWPAQLVRGRLDDRFFRGCRGHLYHERRRERCSSGARCFRWRSAIVARRNTGRL